jgi:hypothetical protein
MAKTVVKNSESFLNSFAAIEKHLRSIGKADRSASFYQVVDSSARSDRVVRRYRDDLKEYADLRNAIVHERFDGHVIAEPNDRAVADLSKLQAMLTASTARFRKMKSTAWSVIRRVITRPALSTGRSCGSRTGCRKRPAADGRRLPTTEPFSPSVFVTVR